MTRHERECIIVKEVWEWLSGQKHTTLGYIGSQSFIESWIQLLLTNTDISGDKQKSQLTEYLNES